MPGIKLNMSEIKLMRKKTISELGTSKNGILERFGGLTRSSELQKGRNISITFAFFAEPEFTSMATSPRQRACWTWSR